MFYVGGFVTVENGIFFRKIVGLFVDIVVDGARFYIHIEITKGGLKIVSLLKF